MLLIFDWDGTLCDSTGRIAAAMRQAADELDLAVPTEQAVREVIGLGLPEAMQILFPSEPLDRREAMRAHYSTTYTRLDAVPAGLFPGVQGVLDQLLQEGHRLAVATGKGRRGLDRVLRGLQMESYFEATRCADETASKPDPLMLFELLQELGVEACDALVIGDSEFDLRMASAAGVDSAGVSYGVHSAERLRDCGPRWVLDDLRELPGLLAR